MQSQNGWKHGVLAAALIAGAYGLMMLAGISCPLRFLTGVSCPGCGATRAWLAALHGDLRSALRLHPLFWILIPAAAAYLLRKRIPRRIYRGLIWFGIWLLLVVYALRLWRHTGNVVVFAPAEGLVGRLVLRLINR